MASTPQFWVKIRKSFKQKNSNSVDIGEKNQILNKVNNLLLSIICMQIETDSIESCNVLWQTQKFRYFSSFFFNQIEWEIRNWFVFSGKQFHPSFFLSKCPVIRFESGVIFCQPLIIIITNLTRVDIWQKSFEQCLLLVNILKCTT